MDIRARSRISLMLTLAAVASCKTSSSKTLSEAPPAPQGLGLDVNDVSILFPLPGDESDIGKMIPISFKNADGVSPMSDALFKDIISHHEGRIMVDGRLEPLASGASFDGKNRNGFTRAQRGQTLPVFGPFGEIGDWKIVAMRYDPCAPDDVHNLRGRAPQPMPQTVDGKCSPQLRLTAQPILPLSRESVVSFQRRGATAIASDYAIHMLFTLKAGEPEALYRELQAFKQECGDVTSSVPLSTHPCLKADFFTNGYGGPRFQRVAALIQRFAKNYTGTAMMATKSGNDPWVFMNGLIENGKFKQLQIDAVKEDDPSKLKRGKAGNLLEPFLNGHFQQLQFVNLNKTRRENEFNEADRVSPLPKDGKVNDMLREQFNLLQPTRFRPVDINSAEVAKTFNRIENPLINDFFSSDCVSCHAAADLYTNYSQLGVHTEKIDATQEIKDFLFGYSSPDFVKEEKHPLFVRQKGQEFFATEEGYTNIVDPYSVPDGTLPQQASGVIHFAYLGVKPNVSFRAANESALVAKLANDTYGNGAKPKLTCSPAKLRSCLTYDVGVGDFTHLVDSDFYISACMKEVCPERALELKDTFSPLRIREYRAKHDVRVTIYKEGTIKAGTVIAGGFVKNFGMMFYHHRPFEMYTDLGEKIYVKPKLHSGFLNKDTWEEDFEEIP